MQTKIPGFTFQDLFEPQRLADLTEMFRGELRQTDPGLHGRYMNYMRGQIMGSVESSRLLIEVASHVGSFLARIFGVQHEHAAMKLRASRDAVIVGVKRDFLVRRALKKYGPSSLRPADLPALERETERIIAALPRS
jgi:hypothetical protein